MGNLLHAVAPQSRIIQTPANIVVAAQIVQEHLTFGQCPENIQLPPQQPHILGRHGVPDGGHGGDVVQ